MDLSQDCLDVYDYYDGDGFEFHVRNNEDDELFTPMSLGIPVILRNRKLMCIDEKTTLSATRRWNLRFNCRGGSFRLLFSKYLGIAPSPYFITRRRKLIEVVFDRKKAEFEFEVNRTDGDLEIHKPIKGTQTMKLKPVDSIDRNEVLFWSFGFNVDENTMTVTMNNEKGEEQMFCEYRFKDVDEKWRYLDEFRCVAFFENGRNVDFCGVLCEEQK